MLRCCGVYHHGACAATTSAASLFALLHVKVLLKLKILYFVSFCGYICLAMVGNHHICTRCQAKHVAPKEKKCRRLVLDPQPVVLPDVVAGDVVTDRVLQRAKV
jgi:hypothetical protein